MANRTTVVGGVWANGAPDPPSGTTPSAGTTYADSGITQSEIEEAWPYASVVDSSKHNELLRRITKLMQMLEQQGVMTYCASTTYVVGAKVLGSNGRLYNCIQAGANHDPTTSPTYWRLEVTPTLRHVFLRTSSSGDLGALTPTAGVYTMTVPAGVTRMFVRVWGGGGGGAGGAASANGYGGTGGAGGGCSEGWFSVTPGATITVTVGNGGGGGSVTTGGSPGGASSFGAHITCGGGNGGAYQSATNTSESTGGTATGGSFAAIGGPGGVVTPNGTSAVGGAGGGSPMGGPPSSPSYGSGSAGRFPGGGGGGAGAAGSFSGGNGAAGCIIVEW